MPLQHMPQPGTGRTPGSSAWQYPWQGLVLLAMARMSCMAVQNYVKNMHE